MTKKIADSNPTQAYESIKLGIDAHAKWFYVARQLDGATPQPVQLSKPDQGAKRRRSGNGMDGKVGLY